MRITYWRDGRVETVTSDDPASMLVDGVLRVETEDDYSQGHDHYWFNDDGSIGNADHHDYDAPGWPVVGCDLPDRRIFNGVMVPDDVAKEVGL